MLKTVWANIVDKKNMSHLPTFLLLLLVLKMSRKGSFLGASEKACCPFEKHEVLYLHFLFHSSVNVIGN